MAHLYGHCVNTVWRKYGEKISGDFGVGFGSALNEIGILRVGYICVGELAD